MADYKRIWFSSVASVGNPSTNFLLGAPFGADNGAGFGVQDVDVIKLGLEWRRSPELTLRAGYSYNTAPIIPRDVDLNIMTLGVVQHHLTGGLKYQVTRNWDVELAAMYAPRASVYRRRSSARRAHRRDRDESVRVHRGRRLPLRQPASPQPLK